MCVYIYTHIDECIHTLFYAPHFCHFMFSFPLI